MADIVTREPFVGSIRQAMERFFDEPFFRDPFMASPFRFISDEGSLPLDVYERDNQIVVEASLPGFKKDEIDVQVQQGVLTIKAQRNQEHEETSNGGRYYRRERSWGAVSRRVALPGTVDETKVNAELKNGVLRLTVPIAEQARPKQIAIQGE
jgi:HSP20 family protein